MLTGITVPTGATKDTRVWVVNRYHNRITTRKIGSDIIRFGSFPPDIVSVTATKGEAIKAMLECRAAEMNNAMREMARAERAMASALKLASRHEHTDEDDEPDLLKPRFTADEVLAMARNVPSSVWQLGTRAMGA